MEGVLDCVERVGLEEGMKANCGETLDVLDSKVNRHEKDDHNSPVEGNHVEEVIYKRLARELYTCESDY